jgi:hypothetical protein
MLLWIWRQGHCDSLREEQLKISKVSPINDTNGCVYLSNKTHDGLAAVGRGGKIPSKGEVEVNMGSFKSKMQKIHVWNYSLAIRDYIPILTVWLVVNGVILVGMANAAEIYLIDGRVIEVESCSIDENGYIFKVEGNPKIFSVSREDVKRVTGYMGKPNGASRGRSRTLLKPLQQLTPGEAQRQLGGSVNMWFDWCRCLELIDECEIRIMAGKGTEGDRQAVNTWRGVLSDSGYMLDAIRRGEEPTPFGDIERYNEHLQMKRVFREGLMECPNDLQRY